MRRSSRLIPAAAAPAGPAQSRHPAAPERPLCRLRHPLDPRLLRVRSPPPPRGPGQDADANDPERLAAICQRCDELKTPQDLKAIARTKRLAFRPSRLPGPPAQQGARPPRPSRSQFEQLGAQHDATAPAFFFFFFFFFFFNAPPAPPPEGP